MKMSELLDLILLESGQFVLDEGLDDLFIKRELFWAMTKQILALYAQYKPYTWSKNIHLASNSYKFTEIYEGEGEERKLVEPIPRFISSVIPVGVISSYSSQFGGIPNFNPNVERISRPLHALWNYEKPMLTTNMNGKVDVTLHSDYITREEWATGSTRRLKEAEIVGLNSTPLFTNLVLAKFMLSVGRSRRMFIDSELPIQVDAESLVEEGQSLYDESFETLKERADFHYSIGN